MRKRTVKRLGLALFLFFFCFCFLCDDKLTIDVLVVHLVGLVESVKVDFWEVLILSGEIPG